jgi:hypothetical protein
LFLLEKFTTYKCKTLEGDVNKLFDRIRWRLFETQINGGISECCDCLVEGISYSVSLNNAAKINAGIEIANVISKYAGYQCPMFVDNADGVDDVYPVESQQIKSYAIKAEKVLRVEIL